MQNSPLHTFHIPVMGLAFSIDSPVKVAPYGISSVVSLSDDTLIEQMREYYSRKHELPYTAITPEQEDYRARRITAYLDLLDQLVQKQITEIRQEEFAAGSRLTQYFNLLPDTSPLKKQYLQMLETSNDAEKASQQESLRSAIQPGSIDVNIMTKLDKMNYAKTGEMLPSEFSDALAALRGFARSTVESSVIFSAGMNMRLYSYLEQFPAFFPDQTGYLAKKIIIKVSDHRSAFVQGKIMAKKGLWVSEFRIESGLNCGGHAFATDGYLLGPILEEFRQNREAMQQDLYGLFAAALTTKGLPVPAQAPKLRITVQGGIGTTAEQEFLLQHYGVDGTGWGTPFLLVPEATTVDAQTMQKLAEATENDLYLSPISPLGVPFNSLRNTSSEALKQSRIDKGKPGSPCVKKHLVSNSEFTDQPICTASRKFQRRKLEQLQLLDLPEAEYQLEASKVLAKECLCEGLANTALIDYGMPLKPANKGVAICPGPNMAYFSGIFSLKEMVDHIYGRTNILNSLYRPHMFVKELKMYVDYWQNLKKEQPAIPTDKQQKYLRTFRENLLQGIIYYKQLLPQIFEPETESALLMKEELYQFEEELMAEEMAVAG
ncbi:nitronate monooxygenase family protein [Adhaeribacter soli]|uniref:Uncharacterized protein n=1 Tax=Adhaeribacter soli TaxID=2607655 RepID=A0A5N1J770_9BACT|nr:hypothetical protein [Adhaeribacter soli]KAA9345963.1 hypothetical protein F0P94_02455 [Adhaeribacter soli]